MAILLAGDIERGIVHSTACREADAPCTSLQFQPIKLRERYLSLGMQMPWPGSGVRIFPNDRDNGRMPITPECVNRRTGVID